MSSCVFTDLPMESSTMTNAMMSQNKLEEKDIQDAAQESYKTGSIVPILKQELRFLIQYRRCTEGKDELSLEPEKEKKMELTDHEKEKKKRRKEQNRMAAMRFRKKNKNKGNVIMQVIETLISQNTALKSEYNELFAERESLVEKLKEHLQICNLRPLDTDLQTLFSRH